MAERSPLAAAYARQAEAAMRGGRRRRGREPGRATAMVALARSRAGTYRTGSGLFEIVKDPSGWGYTSWLVYAMRDPASRQGYDRDEPLNNGEAPTLDEAREWLAGEYPREVAVENMPRRAAHAAHALLVAIGQGQQGPATAAEVMLYDEEALSARATSAGLGAAARRGLCFYDGRYWWPQNALYELRPQLEDRHLADTEREGDA